MYLRSEILWSATEGLCTGSIKHLFFTQTKVGNFDVSLLVQQKILQLHSKKVPVWLPMYADNVALPAFARCCCSNQSISSACWAHSSKPTVVVLLLWAHDGTDRWTPYRFIDPAMHSMQDVPINIFNLHTSMENWL